MRDFSSDNACLRPFSVKLVSRAAGILLILTLISIRLVSGMLAKYIAMDTRSVSALSAGMGKIELHEHRAVLQDGVYVLDSNTVVDSNKYSTLLPGTDIPKDPFIIPNGKIDVSCTLYVEIVDTELPDEVTYTIGTSFEENNALTPAHGGKLYRYKQTIPPGYDQTISHIFSGDKITVSDSFRDRSDTSKNSTPFKIDIYAYLVQTD